MIHGAEFGGKPLELIMNLEGINWYEVDYSQNKTPIPALPKDSALFQQLCEEFTKLKMQARPINRDELAGVLFRLQAHYWAAGLPEKVAAMVAEDYMRLILPSKYAIKAVESAYESYVMNPANNFFPKVGAFNELVKIENYKLQYRLLRLQKLHDKAV